MKQSIRILGIDPGARATGWAVIDVAGNSLSFVEAGVIRAKTHHDRPGRLAAIHQGLTALIERLCPVEAAVEQTFVNASPRDALVLGEARGVALCAPAACGLDVAEYAANSVKKSVVGRGHADKGQVQVMVRTLLPASGKLASDAADALAVAICHAHHRVSPTYRRSA
ncbi:MAG: crossover junction endodeoxyribonuclease RuvC [Parvularculaceae bacterium]|nr:MAG: crossover junction endodeoxyribonuclease RuvC [Parvularculaceae bacterium]